MVNQDTKVLIMVASRNRPQKLYDMLSSFESTKSKGTEIAIYIADDDPCIDKYLPIIKPYTHRIGKWLTQGQVFNKFSSEYKNLKFYGNFQTFI